MDKTLNPCPFCGGKARFYWYVDNDEELHCRVECTECLARGEPDASGTHGNMQDNTIAAWNRRV